MIEIVYASATEKTFTVNLALMANVKKEDKVVGSVNIEAEISLTDHRRLMEKFKPVTIKLPKRMNKKYSEYLNNHPYIRTNLKGLKDELHDQFRCARKETINEIVETVKEQLAYKYHSCFDIINLESAIWAFDQIFNDIICAEEFYRYLHKNS